MEMESEDFPKLATSKACRNDNKLVSFIIEQEMTLAEMTEPYLILWGNTKNNEIASWLLNNYEGQRGCNWLKRPVGLNKNDPERRLLERLNLKIAYGVPNSYELRAAYVRRAKIAYLIQQDYFCLYNLWEAGIIKPDFLVGIEQQECIQMYDRARIRKMGTSYPSPKRDRILLSCFSKALCNDSYIYGRHLNAKYPLLKGDIVVSELPFVSLLLSGDSWMRCHHCLIYAPLVLIPCQNCSLSLYCSQTCRSRAHQEYHSLECSLMPVLVAQYTPIEFLSLRLAIRVFKMFNEVPEELSTYIGTLNADMHASEYNTPYGYNNQPEADYRKVYRLATNRHHVTKEQLTANGLKAVSLAKLFALKHNLPFSFVELLSQLIVRHMHILRVNALVLHCSVDDPSKDCFDSRSVPYALTLLTTGSMFNHSCDANVDYSLAMDGTIKFETNRYIPRGSRVHIDYRRNPSEDRYSFECNCHRCAATSGSGRISKLNITFNIHRDQ